MRKGKLQIHSVATSLQTHDIGHRGIGVAAAQLSHVATTRDGAGTARQKHKKQYQVMIALTLRANRCFDFIYCSRLSRLIFYGASVPCINTIVPASQGEPVSALVSVG